jgi:hypothetical protein
MPLAPLPGQALYEYWNIIPNCPVDTPTADVLIAGEVIGVPTAARPVFFVVMPHIKPDNDVIGGQIQGHFYLRKKTGGGTDFAQFAALTFKTVGSQDYFQLELAGSGDPIHAYCMTKPATSDTHCHVLGPLCPPFSVV